MNTATLELCPKCGNPLLEGQVITGQSWNGDGGAHVNCPDVDSDILTDEDEMAKFNSDIELEEALEILASQG